MAPAASAPTRSDFTWPINDSSRSSTMASVTRCRHASSCICRRLGRLPSRHDFGNPGAPLSSVVPASSSSRNQEVSRQRRSPLSSSMASGAAFPASLRNSGVCALWPTGCEWRKTATTACSASRPAASAGSSVWIWRAFCSSASSSVAQSVLRPSVLSAVATPANSRTASEMPAAAGPASSAAGPINGLVSPHRSASRSAVAKVRSMPRVR